MSNAALEEISTATISSSQRSRLFSLKPYDFGGPNQESLLSYLNRLSYAHGVNPRLLVKYVLAEQNPRIAQIATKAFYQTLSGTMNGLGFYAEVFSDALQSATTRQDLGNLTLLKWKDLFPPNGQALLARHPQWCPGCLYDWGRDTSIGTPFPLAWSFELFQYCPTHHSRLEDQCRSCGSKQDFLPSYPNPGYCQCCKTWLGHSTVKGAATSSHLWISKAITDMVCSKLTTDLKPNIESFRMILKEQISIRAQGKRTAFCQAIGLKEFAVSGWLNKGQRPSAPQFLTVCHGLGVTPTEIFQRNPPENAVLSCKLSTNLLKRKQKPKPTLFERKNWLTIIKVELVSNAPRSVSMLAQALGVSRSCLRYWLPGPCSALKQHHEQFVKHRAVARKAQEIKTVESITLGLIAAGHSLSRRTLDRALRKEGLTTSRKHIRNHIKLPTEESAPYL